MPPAIDLDGLGLDNGGHLLIARALSALRPGESVRIRGHHPALAMHLAAWCRSQGHLYQPDLTVVKGSADTERWAHAERAGQTAATVAHHAQLQWGLAARGALVEPAPDQATADVTMLAGRDEARHVAFGVAHTAQVARNDPAHLSRLRNAVERRHSALVDTAGLNKQVFDSLVVLAAGSWTPAAINRGWQEVQHLQHTMDEGRQRRLEFIGFPADEAAAISALHTRNFM